MVGIHKKKKWQVKIIFRHTPTIKTKSINNMLARNPKNLASVGWVEERNQPY